MANSKCCKYTSGTQNREHQPDRWTLSVIFPENNYFGLHIITAPEEFAEKTIRELTTELTEANDKENLCSLYYTIHWALKNIQEYKNDEIAENLLIEIDEHCEKCGKKDYKCKCIKKLGGDENYNTERVGCEEGYSWSDKKCECKEDSQEQEDDGGDVAPIEDVKIPGCMVNPAGLPDGVTVNYDPLATVNYGCEFKKVIELENKFCFCVTDTCEEIGRCIQGKQVIKAKVSSYESFDKKYNRVYEKVLEAIAKIKNPSDFIISTEKGFYGENSGDYVEDLAKALTILEFRGYGLSAAADGNIKDSDLIMKTLDGDYLGFFSGASMSSPMYKYFNLQLTDPIVRLRVAKNLGGKIVNKRHIKAVQRIIGKEGRESDEVKNINVGANGVINIQENITTVGLGVLLETKVIGLGKLLK
tara:strand:- start:216 stop:1463 length:1248 start_codon:yes stop_codon:yes gene_type:complete